ncbi:hypothetical protein ZWY2020_006262 [Hordeum vulgare]|nr:hypothetical protein ZWY2020_006262 [Hordeum vulgare]
MRRQVHHQGDRPSPHALPSLDATATHTCLLHHHIAIHRGVEEGGEQQAGDSWSNTIAVIGHHLFIRCLQLLPRWDYGTIASLNHEFNSVIRNGDIYCLHRKNGVAEHRLYLSCGNNPLGWEAYDPSTGCWIQVPNIPQAQKYGRQQIAVGTEGLDSSRTNVLSSAEMYDSESETHTWTTLPSMNRDRYRCSRSFMDGKFYVIGVVSSNREVLTCGEEYDLILQSWRVIDNMSHGLNQILLGNPPLLAVVNDDLYAADYSENNDLKQYDKLDNKLIPCGKLPVQSTNKGRDMGFRVCGDRLIVIGPPSNSSDEKVVDVHSWTPDGNRRCGICLPQGHTGATTGLYAP